MSELRDKLLQLTKLRYEQMPLLMENMQSLAKANDPIVPVLKCHLLTEALLDRLIALAIEPNGEAVTAVGLTYSEKLEIASKMILAEDWELLSEITVGSLRKLNKLRNRLAHTLGATVVLEDVTELFMGVDHLMPITPSDDNIPSVLFHYTSFIFGYMLPKYEAVEQDD